MLHESSGLLDKLGGGGGYGRLDVVRSVGHSRLAMVGGIIQMLDICADEHRQRCKNLENKKLIISLGY